jgi:hypothetical protein
LDRDLDITPLELALLGVELRAESLAPLETVNDLCTYVTRTLREERRHQVLGRVG